MHTRGTKIWPKVRHEVGRSKLYVKKDVRPDFFAKLDLYLTHFAIEWSRNFSDRKSKETSLQVLEQLCNECLNQFIVIFMRFCGDTKSLLVYQKWSNQLRPITLHISINYLQQYPEGECRWWGVCWVQNEPPPLFADSFDLLVLCYYQQCLTLSESPLFNSIQCVCSEIIFPRVELCVASAWFGKGHRSHLQFLCAHSCKWNPFLNWWIRHWYQYTGPTVIFSRALSSNSVSTPIKNMHSMASLS